MCENSDVHAENAIDVESIELLIPSSEEIYVRPFPDVDGQKKQVSTGRRTGPLW